MRWKVALSHETKFSEWVFRNQYVIRAFHPSMQQCLPPTRREMDFFCERQWSDWLNKYKIEFVPPRLPPVHLPVCVSLCGCQISCSTSHRFVPWGVFVSPPSPSCLHPSLSLCLPMWSCLETTPRCLPTERITSAAAYLSKLPPVLNDRPWLLSETHWKSRHGAAHRVVEMVVVVVYCLYY